MTRHLIESVKFSSATDGVLLCDCGTMMSVSLFREHRKAAGMSGDHIKAMTERRDWSRESAVRWNRQWRKPRPVRDFTGCEPKGEAGQVCGNCGRRLQLGRLTRAGERRIQHASSRGPDRQPRKRKAA